MLLTKMKMKWGKRGRGSHREEEWDRKRECESKKEREKIGGGSQENN